MRINNKDEAIRAVRTGNPALRNLKAEYRSGGTEAYPYPFYQVEGTPRSKFHSVNFIVLPNGEVHSAVEFWRKHTT